jgi:nitrogen regulatory protein PII 2
MASRLRAGAGGRDGKKNMIAAVINALLVLLGSVLGLALKNKISEKYSKAITAGLGLCVSIIGVTGAVRSENSLCVIICMVLGIIIGETLRIEDALDALGFPCLTAESVTGRGKQRGIAAEVKYDDRPERLLSVARSAGMKYVPKRRLTLIVPDGEVDGVVRTIINVNQTAQVGDGKIFVCPVEEAVRVRTDETGDAALL